MISLQRLQSPFDTDAAYRSKTPEVPKRYATNVGETVGEGGDRVISDFSFQTREHSDTDFDMEYIESHLVDGNHELMKADGRIRQ